MGQESSKKKTKWLLTIWLVLFAILSVISGIRKLYIDLNVPVSTSAHSWYEVFLAATAIIVFIPLQLCIAHYAALAKMREIEVCAKVLTYVFGAIGIIALFSFFLYGVQ